MRLTTYYREERVGTLTGNKEFFLVCQVQFSDEERAIIQERGLYDQTVSLPSGTPLPTRMLGWKLTVMHYAGLILGVPGFLIAGSGLLGLGAGGATAGAVVTALFGLILLAAGVYLFVYVKMRDREARRRIESDDQQLSLRALLRSGMFKIHAYTMAEAREYDQEVRTRLGYLAEAIRDNSVVPEQGSYEF